MDALLLYAAFVFGGFCGFALAAFLSASRDSDRDRREFRSAGVITSPRPAPPTVRLMPSDVTGKATLDGAGDACIIRKP